MSTPAVIDATTPAPLEALRPLPVRQVATAMEEYQAGLRAVLAESDWQRFMSRDGSSNEFPKRSGWRKIALWFGLDLQLVREVIERDENDQPIRARVVGRAVAPNGRAAEDIGACSIRERRFSKPEHDLIATAATRALNRAISNLVGLGELSAEELDAENPPAPPNLPPWAKSATPERIEFLRAGLGDLGLDDEHVGALVQSWASAYGAVPNVLVNTVSGVLKALQHQVDAEDVATPEDVAGVANRAYPPDDEPGAGATLAERHAENDRAIREQINKRQED